MDTCFQNDSGFRGNYWQRLINIGDVLDSGDEWAGALDALKEGYRQVLLLTPCRLFKVMQISSGPISY